MKLASLLIICLCCFILQANGIDNNCNFTIDQLNNKILQPDTSDCNYCITSDVVMSIQYNPSYITSIKLTPTKVDNASSISEITLIPVSRSLIIDENFWIYDKIQDNSSYNFMFFCKTWITNDKLGFLVEFNAIVNDSTNQKQQFVLISNTTIGMLLNASYLILYFLLHLF
ncbi:hypothetical protein ABPG74_004659 [Tetrahymena malaccensis]